MKNKLFITSLSILTIVTSVLIVSCNKQEDTQPKEEQYNEVAAIEDINLENQLTHFIEQAQNPTKNDVVLTTDSAIWYLESSLNYGYADAGKPIGQIVTDSIFIELPIIKEGVMLNSAGEGFNTLVENMRKQFHALNGDENYLQSVDLQIIDGQSKSNDNMVIKASVAYNTKGSAINPLEFGPNDFWSYGLRYTNEGGYCSGPYAGQNTNSDAAEQLIVKVHARKAIPTNRYWYENNISREINPLEFPNHWDDVYDNFEDYLLFVCQIGCTDPVFQQNEHECLTPDEMNFYIRGLEYVIYHYNDEEHPGLRPRGLSFNYVISLYSDQINCYEPYPILHRGDICYGILHISNDPPYDL